MSRSLSVAAQKRTGRSEDRKRTTGLSWERFVTRVSNRPRLSCPTQTRQLLALYHYDLLTGQALLNYMQRAAMKTTGEEVAPGRNKSVAGKSDVHLCGLLLATGPRTALRTCREAQFCRNVRAGGARTGPAPVLYSQGFANEFARFLLCSKGKADTTWMMLFALWVKQQNAETFLHHPRGNALRKVYKDILVSPRWDELLDGFVTAAIGRGEYRALTVDVTYKTAKKAVRGTAPDHQGVITVCGASRALVAAAVCMGEGPDEVVAQLRALVPMRARGQVEFVCLDKFDTPGLENSCCIFSPISKEWHKTHCNSVSASIAVIPQRNACYGQEASRYGS